jgi:hypothetical protein
MDKHGGPPEASSLKPTDRAYLAGIIDGEGGIGIYPRKKGGSNYFLKLSVTNTFYGVVDLLLNWLGGATVFKRNDPPHQRPTWTWSIYQQNAIRVIRYARPYMRIKAAQADLAEQFIDEFKDNRGRGKRVPAEQVVRREWFYQQMMALNRPHEFRRPERAAAETKRGNTSKEAKR